MLEIILSTWHVCRQQCFPFFQTFCKSYLYKLWASEDWIANWEKTTTTHDLLISKQSVYVLCAHLNTNLWQAFRHYRLEFTTAFRNGAFPHSLLFESTTPNIQTIKQIHKILRYRKNLANRMNITTFLYLLTSTFDLNRQHWKRTCYQLSLLK